MEYWKAIFEVLGKMNLPLPRLDEKKARLDALRPIPAIAVQRLRETIALEWTYHSNAIEGNTLSLMETRAIIEDGITIKGKSLREHLEAVNHHEAIEEVVRLAGPGRVPDEETAFLLHRLVLQKIEKEFAGRYRPVSVRITGAVFVPPNPVKVPALMADLMQWVKENPFGLHPVLLAAAFHHRFIWIHPFIDGNGRTVRLLHNLYLMSQGYPPAIILKEDRKKYYRALQEADEGKPETLALLMVQAAERTLDIYLSSFEGRAEDYKPISDLVEEEGLAYGQEYLGLLARRGKIDAYKEGNVWYTSLDAIAAYRKGRKRKRG